MSHLLFPHLNHRTNGGFRLERFEVLNWGTFDRKIWSMDLHSLTGLLTGANGSGKSTLVDGLLTLLVPNVKRNYNQASNTMGKRERDEKSYIQGAYGGSRIENEYGAKRKFLRSQGTISILLAYFYNSVNEKNISLAQVLWMNQSKVEKFFLMARQPLTIQNDFPSTTISELKQFLKEKDVEIFTEFSKYQQSFLRIFGLQSDKALDLFNQTISLKDIKGFNDFVRNQMLSKEDVQSQIQELEKAYNDLTSSYTTIKKAKEQLDLLKPLEDLANQRKKILPEISNLEELQKVCPAYFANIKMQLFQEKLRVIEQEITQINLDEKYYADELNNLEKQQKDLNNSIEQNFVKQRLNTLEVKINTLSERRKQQKKKANLYNENSRLLGFPEYQTEKIFEIVKNKSIPEKQNTIRQEDKDLNALRDEKISQQSQQQQEISELKEDLLSLKGRKNKIPNDNLKIRNQIIKALNIPEDSLPFIGELLQVHPEQKLWESSIERLLRNFALSVLVPYNYYQKVNDYVNSHNLKGRFVYFRIKSEKNLKSHSNFSENSILSKLEIKNDHPLFTPWLVNNLSNSWNYICCETAKDFDSVDQGITPQGLIKHKNNRHEKDDRKKNDRSNYVLGWNNQEKIAFLEQQLAEKEQELLLINKAITALDNNLTKNENIKSSLTHLSTYQDFAEIDWQSTERQLTTIQLEKQSLLESSNQLQELEEKLEKVNHLKKDIEKKKENILIKKGGLLKEKETYQDRYNQAKNKANQCTEKELNQFKVNQYPNLSQKTLHLDSIEQEEQDITTLITKQIKNLNEEKNNLNNDILNQIKRFKDKFIEDTIEIGNSLEDLDEYLTLMNKIEQDDLPRYEQKFKDMMNHKIIQSIYHFKHSLDEQEEKIKADIDELNKSLKQINYSDRTYVKLVYEKNRDPAIAEFRYKDLANCLGNISKQSAEDNQEKFINISNLIKKFQEEESWRLKVTDVRNWLNFSVSECYQDTCQEKEHYTDSSGKSGGQKAKLAYTILASAIAHRFGLNEKNSDQKSFRFVVIDEAFSKLDDNNARYAMELFKNLNLQLLVVTPKDKIHVIENYISTIHLVSNTKEENYSSIQTISINQFKEYQNNK